MQEIIVYILVILAAYFLIKKYFIPSKKVKKCSSDCGCH
ncbi:FeoB-associated Cys-rich membrane protein [Polaribacter sp. IC066]|nr:MULTISPECIES: FeoB-associated Cys-rich membrane protein [unclassified Polaribacter]TXD53176.1 FeoB-associated Cys-rich membrane protein [Polaribacter sp. IC063]TXD61324.1 FeoB-associated Cys-rich membrane protein [Polaribacter sp. IC066]